MDSVMSESQVLIAIAAIALSGVPGLVLSRQAATGQLVATLLAVIGGTLGILAAVSFTLSGVSHPISWKWAVPGGEFAVALDGIAVVFLLPIFVIPMLGSIYGLSYWKQAEHPLNGRKLRLCYGLVTAALGLVVIAKNAVLFLLAWEIMALAAFFLVTTEDEQASVREVGWIYIVATHTGTLCLFAMFGMLRAATGSLALTPLGDGVLSPAKSSAIFLLALAGFGLKAGMMPLHIWLPGAHAMAPSHVSALMSGVLIKIGIYGLVRVSALLPNAPVWWGALVLALGTISGVLGVAFAIGQHDLKRLLAYHSVENIGIILMGIGLALIGRSVGRPDWVLLGLAGGLLHVWNHGLFKSLLFLSAGSVIHAVHTREIDHLGGLAKSMPRTALCFAVGSVAICGLPPLNGFVSELFIYIGLFRTLGIGDGAPWAAAALAASALALIGALALACFVKAHGAVFLGTARSEHALYARESGPSMIGPMGVLVAGCAFIGLAPGLVAPVLEQAVSAWAPGLIGDQVRLASIAPLAWISVMGVGLVVTLVLGAGFLRRRIRASELASGGTWDCGYAASSPSMQYTSSSFAEMLVKLFAWVLRPKVHATVDRSLFAREGEFHSHVPDTVLDGALLPSFRGVAWLFSWFRFLQRGSIQAYLLYIVAALIAMLFWSAR
jgi:hydrogenase-4 component B